MEKIIVVFIALLISLIGVVCMPVNAQDLDDFEYKHSSSSVMDNAVINDFSFNGYTTHWQDTYRQWIRYGNLFKIAKPDIKKTIAQSKVDIAEDLGIPGLSMQEGFLDALLEKSYVFLDQPNVEQVENSLADDNVLIVIDSNSGLGKQLNDKNTWKSFLKEDLDSHQFNAADFTKVNAFMLEGGERRLFVISSESKQLRNRVGELVGDSRKLLGNYDLHRGWFGAKTLLNSVTITPGHPLEVIGKGMNEGNTWFVFDGYMDYVSQDDLEIWTDKVNVPVVVDVGSARYSMYGLENYEGYQVQRHRVPREYWIEYADKKNGFIFRPVYEPEADNLPYDGYIAGEGNKKQIDNENVPFVSTTGNLLSDDAVSSMVLFHPKGKELTKEGLWEAILDRRNVAVLEEGKMMGPALYRNVLQMLLLDRVYLEEYFGDRISLEAETEGYELKITVINNHPHAVSGEIDIELPRELDLVGDLQTTLDLAANSKKTLVFSVQPKVDAMDKTNPIAVHYNRGNSRKSTLTKLDLPPAITANKLLYGHSPTVSYPVSVHNFTDQSSFPVKVEVLADNNALEPVFEAIQNSSADKGSFEDMEFELEVPPGKYDVKVSALGKEKFHQLGVGEAKGTSYAYETDLNADGISEYRMENDSVRITLLTTGARVIEYIVKSREDNVLFKIWPEKMEDHKRPFRKRYFYPYGGFEDFLGQPSMETHKMYDAEIIKEKGDYVRVKMEADYYGNRLEKIYTLYANSQLLEVRFALNFTENPEANVLGPQPILKLGEEHGAEDVFMVPTKDGLKSYRPDPETETRWGRYLDLHEGWYAGYDTKEDITFVGAYPVTQPLYLHMWMNNKYSRYAPYDYIEFQPWTRIYDKNTMYFTHYLWGAGGAWEDGVEALRDRNLITTESPE